MTLSPNGVAVAQTALYHCIRFRDENIRSATTAGEDAAAGPHADPEPSAAGILGSLCRCAGTDPGALLEAGHDGWLEG
jgi:hypothetical protein